MSEVASLETAMRRCILLAAGVCTSLLLMTIASLALAFITAGNSREVAARSSTRVVPGAVGDAKSPGITVQNHDATTRRLSNR